MKMLKFFRNVAICGLLISTSTAQAMSPWDLHNGIINEYDDIVPQKTANKYFNKFSSCITDPSWCDRKTRGTNINSNRYQGSPRLIFDFLKDAYSPSLSKVVVDLAGADGRVAELALFTGAKVVLIDINKKEIEEADKRIKETRKLPQELIQQYQSHVADALTMDEQLPELIGQVDDIHMSNLIHYFDDEKTEKVLKNIHLFLKAGGKIHGQVDSIYTATPETIAEFLEREKSGQKHPGIFSNENALHNFYSIESIETLFEKFGFSKIKTYYSDGATLPTNKKEESIKVVFSFEKK